MDRKWKVLRYLSLAAGLTLGVVAWEYLLNALMNPQVDWNLVGVGAHMALDVAILLPLLALALGLGLALARRLGMTLRDSAGLLGTVGVVALVAMALMLPVTSSRDLAHDWMGYTYNLSLAEVQTTIVRSDLTVQDATQLCSFGSVRNPSLARDTYQSFELTVLTRVAAGLTDALKQQAALLPLLLLGFLGLTRRETSRWSAAPVAELLRTRTVRLGVVASASAFALFCVGVGFDDSGVAVATAQAPDRFNACTDGGPVREYDISAIDVTITLNRWGDHVNDAFMYALDANIADIRAEEQALQDGREAEFAAGEFLPDVRKVSFGLRDDLIQPLVIRANLGECLRINFTNTLADGEPASLHILGLPHTVENAGSAVGNNPDTFADPGETVTYNIPLPLDMDAERSYYFHDHGAGRRRQNKGLFGAIVAEPPGSKYFDAVTGDELTNETGSNWEAIIEVPQTFDGPVASASVDGGDNISFREFVIIYHEIGDEFFTDIRDKDFKKVPLVDDVAGVYRPGARALNFRSEPFRRRIEFDKEINNDVFKNGKKHGYASYPFGDPPTPLPRSYVGEPTKTRLMHGSSEVFHVHHLHGGGDRWRRNPNADPNNDFWKGLTKNPDPNLTSIHLDSQSIGPGTSYNLEHECGAGGCQQGVGDFLFHCHIGHHYIAGMWSFWRVFGTVQTAENNVYGFPLAVKDFLWQTDNPFSDEEAPGNTPPDDAISAGDLAGIVVDGGRTLTHGPSTGTEMNIQDWVRHILPPAGVTDDNNDSTVLDWVFDGEGAGLRVMGEPEEAPFIGYVSPIGEGNRIEITFNPKNGRYTWPLYRPHQAKRMPFTARHTGAPWLGEQTDDGRIDGLCAMPGFHPSIDENLPSTAVKRFYPISAISLPIEVGPGKIDPDGQIFVLNEEEAVIRANEAVVVAGGNLPADGSYLERKRAEPLAIRSNVGDCNELIFTNKVPDGPLNKDWSNVNMHHHFLQFDTQASDGVITGFSYEQAVRPIESEDRRLVQRARPGDMEIVVNHVDGLHPELVPGNLANSGARHGPEWRSRHLARHRPGRGCLRHQRSGPADALHRDPPDHLDQRQR